MCICACMYAYMYIQAIMWIYGSEDNLWEWVLSIYYVNPRNQTPVVIFGSKCLYSGPRKIPFFKDQIAPVYIST